MRSDWKSKTLSVLLLMYILWLPDIILGATETVSIPVTLEYPFIKSVLIHQLYKAPGERAIVIDDTQGDCVHIELSNPEVGPERSLIKVGSNIKIRAGVPILGYCAGTMEWEGYVEVLQRLVLDEKSWRARFETIDSRIYDINRNPGTIAGRFWDLIKTHVHPYLDRTNIELAPPIKEMKEFLPLAFLPKERRQVDRWLETLRPGPVQMEESAVKVNILLDVQTTPKPRASTGKLSPSEIENLTRTWEDWDAFLIFEIESLIGQPITDVERGHLMEIILENRHEFLQALDNKTISSDLVRQQFIRTWQRFSHILRKYLVDQKSRPSLGYLAFFTASDALVALDKLGPTLGVEISRDGLIRLARLLSTSGDRPDLEILLLAGSRTSEIPWVRSTARRFRPGFGCPGAGSSPGAGNERQTRRSAVLAWSLPVFSGLGERGAPEHSRPGQAVAPLRPESGDIPRESTKPAGRGGGYDSLHLSP